VTNFNGVACWPFNNFLKNFMAAFLFLRFEPKYQAHHHLDQLLAKGNAKHH
jgi:hypothetical protein